LSACPLQVDYWQEKAKSVLLLFRFKTAFYTEQFCGWRWLLRTAEPLLDDIRPLPSGKQLG
jgi:hypothetical protein